MLDRRAAMTGAIGAALAAGCATVGGGGAAREKPLVIAHRGASGHRPEHTLSAYRLAIAQGADFIEPDLVLTADGHLVCRHENEISGTTNVAALAEFADRRTRKVIDGASVEGWFTEDFTLAELQTLRCRERLPQLRPANTAFDDQDIIPTFAAVIGLARAAGVGVYPETKHPKYFEGLGLGFDAPLLADLRAAGWDRADAPVFIQSFEVENLRRLRGQTAVKLVQLLGDAGGPADRPDLSYPAMTGPAGLRAIRRHADGVGPHKRYLLPRDGAGASLPPTDFVTRAHDAGLLVHPWTFRNENAFLPAELRRGADPAAHGEAAAELRAAFAQGVDGVFADFPETAVAARGAGA